MITFDAKTAYDHISASSKTFSHTVAVDSNFLVLCCSIQGTVEITGVTYNGVAMTNAGVDLLNDRESIWYLINPAIGANNVIVSYSGSDVGNGVAISFKGVDTSDPVGSVASLDSGVNVSFQSKQITTEATNSLILDYIWLNDSVATNIMPDGSQVERHQQNVNGIDEVVSTLQTTSAGNYNMGWTWDNAVRALQGIIEIKASATTTTQTPSGSLALIGVGM